MNNRVVHFEIPANEPESLTAFYEKTLGWTFQKAPIPGLDYYLATTGDDGIPGINGAITKRQNAGQPWMNYIDVPALDETVEKAVSNGGQVALPKMPVPGVGHIACIVDPEGNVFGLIERAR